MPRRHHYQLNDGSFDSWLLKYYREGMPTSVIEEHIPGGLDRLKYVLQPEKPAIEAERRAVEAQGCAIQETRAFQDAQLVQLYSAGVAPGDIDKHIPGGYDRCTTVLQPAHPQIEAERRAAQDVGLLKRYREGESSEAINEYVPGGYQRCLDTFAKNPEIENEQQENVKIMLLADIDRMDSVAQPQ